VGGWSIEEKSRREAAGLIGDGEMGVRGILLAGPGDSSERVGRAETFWAEEMLRESLGLAARAAYILNDMIILDLLVVEVLEDWKETLQEYVLIEKKDAETQIDKCSKDSN
jgi:hypothetical protein